MAFQSPRIPPDAGEAKARIGVLKTLWPFVMRQRGLFVAWLAALALSSAATLSLPMAVRQKIDHGFTGGDQIDRAFTLLLDLPADRVDDLKNRLRDATRDRVRIDDNG